MRPNTKAENVSIRTKWNEMRLKHKKNYRQLWLSYGERYSVSVSRLESADSSLFIFFCFDFDSRMCLIAQSYLATGVRSLFELKSGVRAHDDNIHLTKLNLVCEARMICIARLSSTAQTAAGEWRGIFGDFQQYFYSVVLTLNESRPRYQSDCVLISGQRGGRKATNKQKKIYY